MQEELIRKLMHEGGITKQMATSQTAEACYKVFMPDNAAALLNDAAETVKKMKTSYNEMFERLEHVAEIIESTRNPQLTDEKASNIVGLFASLLDIAVSSYKNSLGNTFGLEDATGREICGIIKDVSYIAYAYANNGACMDIINTMKEGTDNE